MRQLVRTGYFKISDLPFDEGQRHTVRRVLREMEEREWLERETNRAAIWRIGERGKTHLNVSAEKIQQAEAH